MKIDEDPDPKLHHYSTSLDSCTFIFIVGIYPNVISTITCLLCPTNIARDIVTMDSVTDILTLYIQVTPKFVFWQTVKTQRKCCIVRHFLCIDLHCLLRRKQERRVLSGRVLDSRPRSRRFEPHRRRCIVSLSKGGGGGGGGVGVGGYLEEPMKSTQHVFYANASLSSQVLYRKHYISMSLGQCKAKL